MSILALIGWLAAAWLSTAAVGALLELLAVPLTLAIPKHTREAINVFAAANTDAGRPPDRFIAARMAPGLGHLIVGYGLIKDLIVFGGLGVANAFIVSRFLENPDRIDWIWYVLAGLNATPAMPRHKSRDLSIWFRLFAIATYASTSLYLAN